MGADSVAGARGTQGASPSSRPILTCPPGGGRGPPPARPARPARPRAPCRAPGASASLLSPCPSSPAPPSSRCATPPPVRTTRAIAAARTCYAPRVIGAEEVTPGAAGDDRPAHLRGRPPHRLAARALRVRARERQPAVRLVVPALAPLLQLRAVLAALRPPRRGAGARAGGARRPRRARSTRARSSRPGRATAALTALLKRGHAADPLGPAPPDAERLREAAEEGRARGREEGDRDGALRHPGRGLHLDGPHASRASSCTACTG